MTLQNSKITTQTKAKKSTYIALWLACVVGACAVIPYTLSLRTQTISISLKMLILIAGLQSALFTGIVCWLSYILVPKTDLEPFSKDRPFRAIVLPGLIGGASVGLIIYLLDITIFKTSAFAHLEAPAAWTGLLASIYGAVNEEVLLRLFLFTLIYFCFRKIFKAKQSHRNVLLWTTNVIVALLFGIGHLPAAFQVVVPSVFSISRILVLNGIAGLLFGYMYWSRGLWAAMFAHFVGDLVLHVFT